jgi:hypothetical protein
VAVFFTQKPSALRPQTSVSQTGLLTSKARTPPGRAPASVGRSQMKSVPTKPGG